MISFSLDQLVLSNAYFGMVNNAMLIQCPWPSLREAPAEMYLDDTQYTTVGEVAVLPR
jgi:hypothetical protein